MRRGAADFRRLDDDVVAGVSVLARRFAGGSRVPVPPT
jgi:hypothetical protein